MRSSRRARDARLADGDPVGQAFGLDTLARARATESASNSTPTSSSSGNRRAIAMSQRPPPQWTSTTRPPRDRSATSCGSAARPPGRRPRCPGAVRRSIAARYRSGRSRIGVSGPEEVDHPAPVQRGDDGVDELAAEVVRPARRRAAWPRRRRRRSDDRPRGRRGRARRPPMPRRRRRSGRGSRSPRRARRARCPLVPARPEALEQAKLEPEVDQPRAVEPAEAGDQVVEAVVVAHRAGLSHGGPPPDGVAARYRTVMQRSARSLVLGDDGHDDAPRTDRRGRHAPPRRPGRDLDGPFEDARQRATRTASTRSPCGCSAIRTMPRRRPRTPWSGPTGRWPATTPTRIRELRLRRWLATIVLNLCRTRLGRRAGHGRARPVARRRARRLARAAQPPSRAVPRTPSPQRRAEREAWAARLLRLPPAYRGRRRAPPRRRPVLSRDLPPPSVDPRAPSRPRSIGGWPCCARCSKPPKRPEREEMTA